MQKTHLLSHGGRNHVDGDIGVGPVSGVGPSFRPDTRFTGATLTGWTQLGEASWRAENGEIIGTPKSAAGGWLMLNRSFQDVGSVRAVSLRRGLSGRHVVSRGKDARRG